MITWIGLCAGEIWRYLDAHAGSAPLQDLFKGVKAPQETILMATGWLGREGYVLIDGNLPNPVLTLNPKPPSRR